MTREELEHAIRAACDVAGDHEVYVLGSQAILGQYPNAPAALLQSAEADIVPKNKPERADEIDGALGELSAFHSAHGFYVHGLTLDAATLPADWEIRSVRVSNANASPDSCTCSPHGREPPSLSSWLTTRNCVRTEVPVPPIEFHHGS